MDPGEQPLVLSILTQVEEMLISRVNPILQVTHAHARQYKYSGHTISFPWDISTILSFLTRRVEDLDILVVTRKTLNNQSYDFIVNRSHVLAALEYKISHDPYSKDVQVDQPAIMDFSIPPTNVSPFLRHSHSTAPNSSFPIEDVHPYQPNI